MELDLRKPGVSKKIGIRNDVGFTNYIISKTTTLSDIVVPLDLHPNMFIVTSGPIPPNPAETLLNARTEMLINELKSQFDYIIIDAPPVGIVADAQLLVPYSDLCIYLVRQGFTNKEQLNLLHDLKSREKIKNLAIVVNDIKADSGYGYGYGYGYDYGYGNYNIDS
jgi:capsular exopolysaccharide synthesis family protein